MVVIPHAKAEEVQEVQKFTDVSIHKEWKIPVKSKKVTLKDLEVALVDSEGEQQGIIVEKIKNEFIIKPKQPYKYGTEYSLHVQEINVKNPLWLQIDFTTEYFKIENPTALARIADIKEQYEQLKPVYTGKIYVKKPSLQSPYDMGELQKGVLTDALNTTNLMRYIAGLPGNIQLNDNYNKEAQAAALISAINPNLSHSPSQPSNMEKNLYDLAYKGASKSNLSKGRNSIVDSIIYGYMNDGSASNIDRVGHRLWILSPKLKEVGFGLVTGSEEDWHTTGSAMKVIEDNMYKNSDVDYEYISWPAKTATPTNYFEAIYPWSFSLNPKLYDVKAAKEINITVTRLKDNKKWHFNQSKSDGYFNISTSNYGYLPYTIIFRPENVGAEDAESKYIEYEHGDHYKVEIANVKRINGEITTIEFETTFFNIEQ